MKITKTLLKQIIKEEYDKVSKEQATWITDEYGIATWTYKEWTLKKINPTKFQWLQALKVLKSGLDQRV